MIEWEIEDPLIKEPQLQGQIDREDVLKTFTEFDWNEMLIKDDQAQQGVFFHSPSIYFKDRVNDLELCFSLFGQKKDFIFLVFYVRTKVVKGFLGFGEKEKRLLSSQRDVSFKDCQAILNLFVAQDKEALENIDWE